ncbi:hypothetical protein ACFLZH_05265 [Patescibacteria group bacterium]
MKEFLKKIGRGFKKGWMKFAHTLGRINTTILLTIFYIVLVGIYAILIGFPKRIYALVRKNPETYYITLKKSKDLNSYKYPF